MGTVAESTVAALLNARQAATGGTHREAVARLTDDEFGLVVRSTHTRPAGEPGYELVVDPGMEHPDISAANADALERLSADALGRLRVRWEPTEGAPIRIDGLGFVRRGLAPSAVWDAFARTHAPLLASLWGVHTLEEIQLTEERPLGVGLVVLRGQRVWDGLPVDGQFFEVFVTRAGSALGDGVLTGLGGRWSADLRRTYPAPRAAWLTEAAAISRILSTQERAESPLGRSLHLSATRDGLRPRWVFSWRSGRQVTVDAITGATLSDALDVDPIGPVRMMGLPPLATGEVAIRYRGGNVVNASGVSQGSLDPMTGEHAFTTNASWQLGLEGPVGGGANSVGRVFRERFVMATNQWTPIALRQPWNPFTQPASTLNWAPNHSWFGDTLPHSTMLVYGWLVYGQSLIERTLGYEVADRLSFVMEQVSGSDGIRAGQAAGGDMPADANGHTNWAAISMSVGVSDDVDASYHDDGLSFLAVAHEFGHTFHRCAQLPGEGCGSQDVNLIASMDPQRMGSPSNWHPNVYGGSVENIASS